MTTASAEQQLQSGSYYLIFLSNIDLSFQVHHLKGEMAVIHDVHEKKQMSDIQEQLKTTSSGEIKAETRNSNLFQMETTQKSRFVGFCTYQILWYFLYCPFQAFRN